VPAMQEWGSEFKPHATTQKKKWKILNKIQSTIKNYPNQE
jgi:hypothetical protein